MRLTLTLRARSGYNADPYYGCYSNFPMTAYTASTFCHNAYENEFSGVQYWTTSSFTYNGNVYPWYTSGVSGQESPASWVWSTAVMDISQLQYGDNEMTGFTSVGLVTLIHRGAQDGSPTPTVDQEVTPTNSAEGSERAGGSDSGASTARARMRWLIMAGALVMALAGGVLW